MRCRLVTSTRPTPSTPTPPSSPLVTPPRTPRAYNTGRTPSGDSDAADDSFSLTSPSPSSPIALLDESMMDVDMSEFVASTLRRNRENDRRSATLTSSMHQREGRRGRRRRCSRCTITAASTMTTATITTYPCLRRHSSSLTQATSPMNAIRSPTRTAGSELHHHLQIVPTSTERSRSGSLSLAGDAMGAGMYGSSLVGWMRSGSCLNSTSSEAVGLGGVSKMLEPSSFRCVFLS